MIWHIFKKDFRLLWPFTLANVAGQLLLALLVYRSQHTGSGDVFEAMAALLTLGLIMTMSLNIALAIHYEAPSSRNQDWLVRPLRPRDLLFAKLLFVAVTINGPIALSGILRGVAEGLPLGATLSAVAFSAAEIALIFTLPLTAIAALTKSLAEAIVAALVVIFIIVLLRITLPDAVTADTGIAWVWQCASRAVLLVMTSSVLLLLYFRRDTRRARWLALAAIVLLMLTRSLPWMPAFVIQQAVSPVAEARTGTTIYYDPKTDAASTPTAGHLLSAEEDASDKHSGNHGTAIVLPLRIVSLPPGSILHVDRMTWTLTAADGTKVYRGAGDAFDVTAQRSLHDPSNVRQPLWIPARTFDRYKDTPLTLEANYWFTVLRGRRLAAVAAVGADEHLPALGHCSSTLNADGLSVDLRCFQTAALPACTSAALEHPGSLQKNAAVFDCTVDYAPRWFKFSAEPIDHWHAKLPFRDVNDAARYAVDAAKLPTARIIVSSFEPQGHYARRVAIPAIRLKELSPPP